MAGVSERGMDLVAHFAGGWLPTWLTPDGYRIKLEELEQKLQGYGRTLEQVRVGDEIVVCLGTSDEDAVARSKATVGTFTSGFTARSEEEALAASLIGSVDTVRERARALADAGVQHFEMKPIYHSIDDLKGQMERFASGVMVEFR